MTMRSSRPQGETRPFFKQPARRLQGLRASVWLTEYSAAIGLNDVVGNPHVLVVAHDALTVRVRAGDGTGRHCRATHGVSQVPIASMV
jgi:hypothetical protein